MNAKKVTKKRLTQPKDLNEVNELVAEIGDIDGQLAKEKARTERLIARVRAQAKVRVEDVLVKRSDNVKRITRFAKKHRKGILPVNRKSLELTAGTIGWRFGPFKVSLSSEEETIITWLEANKMPKYLRYDVALNKEQLLEEKPSYVPGMSFEQKEFFFIEPKAEPASPVGVKVVDMVKVA